MYYSPGGSISLGGDVHPHSTECFLVFIIFFTFFYVLHMISVLNSEMHMYIVFRFIFRSLVVKNAYYIV